MGAASGRACDRRRWQRAHGDEPLQISVNVSASQLMATDFCATVAAVLADTDTDPACVDARGDRERVHRGQPAGARRARAT